jgi:RecG-like helicase
LNGAVKLRRRTTRIIDSDRPCDALDLPLGVDAIGTLGNRQRATIEGRIRRVRLQPLADSPMLVCEVVDASGGLELLFYGRRSIPGMVTGAKVTATGLTQSHHGTLAIANPRYELHAS